MAGKNPGRTAPSGTRRGRDAGEKLEKLARTVADTALRQHDPSIDIPIRALSNVAFNEKSRTIEMGDNKQQRNFFNYGQAKRFMQTMLVASKCKDLIDADKTASIRQIYYMAKHTIRGTSEKTFDDQSESDPILEDLEVAINSLREELHIFASNRGNLVGPITLVDDGNTLDCARMGSAGYAVPSIVEPDVVQFKKCDAKFILHVEKDTVWRRFHEDRFWEKHRCIVSHGGGQPARGMRRLLFRMHYELKLPVYVLLDNDPWGYYIYSVIKQGSINLAYESKRMAVPEAKFIGVSSFDYERCGLSDDVKLELDANDVKRAKQILDYPWFAGKKPWEKEIRKMIANGFKMEVEAMINKRLTYLTEEYVPMKLADRKQWLD
ncbi:MAG: DNA topoisomerase IV subunit A [Phycisphaerae bacterium]|nr:MAG: DNA topoisomerase IV subunit A [Planctomycetota bacterium]KAB2941653.1 MAG: DNA topoisomerase IV subunit A [Phycisphaerae bacterium]MBE7458750.1 DNA topoisomerase IV subunit A [Planctomycetia bacterium]MCK6465629.1 DNA topoisomerase IV subunit A [Phycisphaerae bacterium]MCL4719505.1 DNA topoisomerase IV subunit A [Phycisphaerae bacterium]